MLPATLVTLATCLLELMVVATPVYNMQPAFITANIGTTGRNIRNLPCISRKNNHSGVCMFAIDCLKANGTHLGTCIDRFYFGSCCHIEPISDIIDNTIESDIIPAREPPERLSSTIKPPQTTHKIITTTTAPSTTKKKVTTIQYTAVEDTTTVGYKLTTFQSVDGSVSVETTTPIPKPVTTRITTTTTTARPTRITTASTTTTITTTRPTTTTTRKPSTRPATISTTTTKKPTTKPSVTTRKPIRTTTTTRRPITTTTRTTTTTTTRRPSTTTTRRKPSVKPSTSTRRPTTTSKKPVTTPKPTKKITIITSTTSTTTEKPTTTTKTTTTSTTVASTTVTTPSTTSKPTTSEVVNKNITQVLEAVNGNLATNEIGGGSSTTSTPSTTTKATIVTWAVVDEKRNTTTVTTATPALSINATEEWTPLTTPDGWVLLPSVPPSTSETTPTTSTTTPKTTTTTESASKPSITYIPLESTTTMSSTLNVSTITTEGVTTQSVPVNATTSSTTPGPPDGEMRPVNMSDFTDVCGRRMYPEARIVGGEKSSFGKWPWQISLRQWRTSTYLHKCGAALLNENWAITAAHCVDNVPPSELLLRLGEHDLSTESEPYLHQERRVQIVASHPQFDPRTFEYDLALLRFYEPVTFQPNILPVCVPQSDENFVGRTAYVTGWGRLYEDGPLPSVLQEVSVPVINNSVCESMYRSAGYIEHIPHIFICAGWRRGGFDSCEGDSGGPMVIQRDDRRFLLAGVISWGIGCAEPNQPGVYTRISEFRDWINQILQF